MSRPGEDESRREDFLTGAMLRRRWKIDRRTLLKWVDEGVMPAYRLPCGWRFAWPDVLAFEDRHRVLGRERVSQHSATNTDTVRQQ